MKTFFPFLLIVFTSCYSKNSTTLTFVNNSSFYVDSIVIQYPHKIVFEGLRVGQQYSKTIKDVEINSNDEGLFPFAVFKKGSVLGGTWGFHDWGTLASANETFYIFDNGVASRNESLKKPQEFKLYFYNASVEKVDSFINSQNAILKVNENSPRKFEIVYDFNKIEASKVFSVAIGGKRKSSLIEHDFSNWNNNQTFFHFEKDSLKKGSLPWREPLEFQVDLEVKLPFPSDSVKVESDAIVKTYYFNQPKYVKIVFDFKKLKQNPVFTVTVSNKRYKVDLSSHDFSNIYYNQKILYLEQTGIRSLTD